MTRLEFEPQRHNRTTASRNSIRGRLSTKPSTIEAGSHFLFYRIDALPPNRQRMQFHSRVSAATVHELLADDCALNVTTEEEMKRKMDLFTSGCAHFGLTINTEKTVEMHQQPSNAEHSIPRIHVNDTELNTVDNFNYLGSTMSH
ncbi:hypothetical protein SprV_0301339800 [Sparganum proliferum]